MRIILFLLLLIPAVSNAQFKRSATELAKDNIRDYVTQKLFRNLSYQPISFGELTTNAGGGSTFSSLIKHKFAITEIESHENMKVPVQKEYLFVFYFNDKMKVQMAESLFPARTRLLLTSQNDRRSEFGASSSFCNAVFVRVRSIYS